MQMTCAVSDERRQLLPDRPRRQPADARVDLVEDERCRPAAVVGGDAQRQRQARELTAGRRLGRRGERASSGFGATRIRTSSAPVGPERSLAEIDAHGGRASAMPRSARWPSTTAARVSPAAVRAGRQGGSRRRSPSRPRAPRRRRAAARCSVAPGEQVEALARGGGGRRPRLVEAAVAPHELLEPFQASLHHLQPQRVRAPRRRRIRRAPAPPPAGARPRRRSSMAMGARVAVVADGVAGSRCSARPARTSAPSPSSGSSSWAAPPAAAASASAWRSRPRSVRRAVVLAGLRRDRLDAGGRTSSRARARAGRRRPPRRDGRRVRLAGRDQRPPGRRPWSPGAAPERRRRSRRAALAAPPAGRAGAAPRAG